MQKTDFNFPFCIEATVTIDFDATTVTIESDDTSNAFMYDSSEFINAPITKE